MGVSPLVSRISEHVCSAFVSLRHYIGIFREEYLLQKLRNILESISTHSFRVLSIEPQHKDGGVFIKFAYQEQSQSVLADIDNDLHVVRDAKCGFPT